MYRIIVIWILFSLFLVKLAFTVNIVLSFPNSDRTINIDSFKENGKNYIHLPSLIMKIDGTLSVQDNLIKILIGDKNVSLDFQSSIASINEFSATKLIQLQNQIKLWQDTIWIEINDAKTLVKYITGGSLEINEGSIETTKSIENTTQNIQNTVPDATPSQNTSNLEEISEKNLLEEIKPIQENTIQREKSLFTLDNIYIDPGHGGDDSGVIFSSGKKEKETTLLIAVNLNEKMKKNNINTVMSREDDRNKNIRERCSDISDKKADYFLSIHTEMPEKEKEGIYIFVPKITDSSINAKNNYIADEMIKAIKEKYKDIEIKKILSPLLLYDNTNIPGILIEIYPKYTEDLKEEKWDTFLDKKSDLYTTIVDVLVRAKNYKE